MQALFQKFGGDPANLPIKFDLLPGNGIGSLLPIEQNDDGIHFQKDDDFSVAGWFGTHVEAV